MPLDPRANILLVDDHAENLLALEAMLEHLGENLVKAQSGEEALRCLLNQDFALILLDVQMPGMSGFETATLIRSRERSRHTPIIFLTAFSTSDSFVFQGYSLGAVDYLLKPIEPDILTSKVVVFVDLFKKTEEVKRQTEALRQQTIQLEAMNLELRQSEERFRSLSACSPVGIFLADQERGCTYTNPRCQSICGFTLAESLGDGWRDFLHPDDRDQATAEWFAYVNGGYRHEFSGEYRFQTKDGIVRWTVLRASPFLSDQGEPMGHVGTVEDITERKQAEEARSQIIQEQAARQQAESANRMKDEFLAILSHELRTPLNSMLGWAKLLRTKKFDEATTTRALEAIERNAQNQARLIEDILDVSLIIRGKLRLNQCPMNLVSVIDLAIESVRLLAEAKSLDLQFVILAPDSNRELYIQITPEPSDLFEEVRSHLDRFKYQVFGDPQRLQQVISNLLTNAIKFTPEQGKVEIRLSRLQTNGSVPTALIQVIDTGIGIHPDFLPYVFERFRQADSTTTRSHGGLGLGLAIVRHLVELSGGTVAAVSLGEGKGATFSIQLPLIKDHHEVVSEPQESVTSFTLNSSVLPLKDLRILVADDEADTRNLLIFTLEQQGAEVIAVASASEAIATLQDLQPDMLISDIGMPEEDGYSLIRKVRTLEAQKLGNIPAIALTAYTREEDSQQAIEAGFQMHIAKPVEPTQLINAVMSLLSAMSTSTSHSISQNVS